MASDEKRYSWRPFNQRPLEPGEALARIAAMRAEREINPPGYWVPPPVKFSIEPGTIPTDFYPDWNGPEARSPHRALTPEELRWCADMADVRSELSPLMHALKRIDDAMIYGVRLRDMSKTELMAACVMLFEHGNIPRYRTGPIG
jgi:hypothetical protein